MIKVSAEAPRSREVDKTLTIDLYPQLRYAQMDAFLIVLRWNLKDSFARSRCRACAVYKYT